MDALEDMSVRYAAVEQRSAIRGAEMQRKYLQWQNASPARPLHTMPDFIVDAMPCFSTVS